VAGINASTTGLAIDLQGLANVKFAAKNHDEAALGKVAKQFEAIFLDMMLKGMRQALPQEDSLNGDSTRLYSSMLDHEWTQKMSERGTGLADLIIKQMSHAAGERPMPSGVHDAPANPVAAPVGRGHSSSGTAAEFGTPQGFARRLWGEAQEAAQATGVPAKFMIGQAALESGWGKREIRGADGRASFNLFGIKAGKNWNGPTVEVLTTEYAHGVARKVTQKFRVYESYKDAFADYGRLLKDNPRYAHVLEHGQDATRFAQNLQRAGYATDPRYAEKLARVIEHSALREMAA
jgi:peptidoglycan hydrolase FlgJ